MSGLTNEIKKTIGIKKGYPLSPVLFVIYIYELEDLICLNTHAKDGCLLHHVLLTIQLFVDNVVLPNDSPKSL